MKKEKPMSLSWNAWKLRDDFAPYSMLFLGIFLLLSLLSYQDGNLASNWFGRLGYGCSFFLFYLFGKSSFLLGVFFLVLGIVTLKNRSVDLIGKFLFLPVFLIATSVAWQITDNSSSPQSPGGVVGQFFSWVFSYLFGDTGRGIVVFFLFLYSGYILFQESVSFGPIFSSSTLQNFFQSLEQWILKSPLYESRPTTQKEMGFREPVPEAQEFTKRWFEKKVIPQNEGITSLEFSSKEPSERRFAPESQEVFSSHPLLEDAFSFPKRKYRNTSLYKGFFEEKSEVFTFVDNNKSMPEKEKKKVLENVGILDLRGSTSKGNASRLITEKLQETKPSLLENVILPSGENYTSSYDREIQDKYPDDFLEEESDFLEEPQVRETFTDSLEEEIVEESSFSDEDEEIGSSSGIGDEEIEESLPQPVVLEEPIQISAFKAQKEESAKETIYSHVPKTKLKKGTYYISTKLLGDHKRPASVSHLWEHESDQVSRRIEEIIRTFGIESKVIGKERGPIITRYELTIPHGLKIGKITSLSDELKMHLAVKSIRIVAPIPGKSSIGIEVPNKNREDVFLSEILKETILQNKAKDLTIAIGKDISGKTVLIDLAKLPHLLVAGTTGSGKSVSINSMITSLICTRSPEEVRFIMIDPKMVEMSLYEDIPHLLMPVITDPKRATKALSWAIQEMEARYQIVSKLKCRDFKSYNEKVEEIGFKKGFEKFPYIVIFIDELADLMMVSGKDLEDQITRISQKSRAVGIHLVMATQRPSVDVITGLIKANCPARVAFHVAQKTDSRTILDTNGAESLLGKGDFLYRSPTSADLARIQAPYVEEKEIEAIVEEAKKQGNPTYVEMNWSEESSSEEVSAEDEELFPKAWRIVVTEQKASASYLQRRLQIGYNKAARLMELMEQRGYVSAQVGSKPREILRSA